MAQARKRAGAVTPRRRGFAKAAMFCLTCGMSLAALGVSVAAVFGAVGGASLAAAVGLVAFVQLFILIGNWRRPTELVLAHPPLVTEADDEGLAQDDPPQETKISENTSPGAAAEVAGKAAAAPAEPDITGINALDEGRLDLYLEPIVELAEARTVYYRSKLAFTRQDGSRMGPYLLSLSAERGGFAPALDLALFRRVCPVVRHLKARRSRRPGVFCPLTPQSFADRDVLDELVGFLRANRDAAGAMVIEMSQSDLAALSPAGMDGLAHVAELGATLSLSEARIEGPDPATLALLGFRFLDLDIPLLAGIHGWDAFDEDGEIRRLARSAEDAGLTVIAANVVRSDDLERVRPFARLARGPLFSLPRIVRRDIGDVPAQAAAA